MVIGKASKKSNHLSRIHGVAMQRTYFMSLRQISVARVWSIYKEHNKNQRQKERVLILKELSLYFTHQKPLLLTMG